MAKKKAIPVPPTAKEPEPSHAPDFRSMQDYLIDRRVAQMLHSIFTSDDAVHLDDIRLHMKDFLTLAYNKKVKLDFFRGCVDQVTEVFSLARGIEAMIRWRAMEEIKGNEEGQKQALEAATEMGKELRSILEEAAKKADQMASMPPPVVKLN